MKVALLLFGQARNIENRNVIRSHHKHIIEKYDTDVFCHTYYSEDNLYAINKRTMKNGIIEVNKDILDIIRNEYKPVAFLHEPPIDSPFESKYKFAEKDLDRQKFKTDYDFTIAKLVSQLYTMRKEKEFVHMDDEIDLANQISQMYSVNKVSKIFDEYSKTKSIKYDYVIITRYDFGIIEIPSLHTLDPMYYYIPNNHKWFPDLIHIFPPKFIRSQFVYDNFERMLLKILNEKEPYDYSYNGLKSFWDFHGESLRYNSYALYFSNTLIRAVRMSYFRNQANLSLQ